MVEPKIIMDRKWSLGLRVFVIIISLIALTGELMPEVEAKTIVVPSLILAIMVCLYDIIKRN